jgi:hypothetical protein
VDRPVLPLLLIDTGVDDHAAPLEVHEPCQLECFFIGLRRPEVVVKLGVSSFRPEVDVDWVSFFDRRFVRSVNTGIFVGFVKMFLLGDKRIRVNANESTARLQNLVSTLNEFVEHFFGGRIVQQISGRDQMEAPIKIVDEFRLAAVDTLILDL